MRRATPLPSCRAAFLRNFNPRSPCGERLSLILCPFVHVVISIHALRAESDASDVVITLDEVEFQSTLSMRRATSRTRPRTPTFLISIHALHAESDDTTARTHSHVLISIHALHAESDSNTAAKISASNLFQSTLSVRRATRLQCFSWD